jgi:hypothetical protein
MGEMLFRYTGSERLSDQVVKLMKGEPEEVGPEPEVD